MGDYGRIVIEFMRNNQSITKEKLFEYKISINIFLKMSMNLSYISNRFNLTYIRDIINENIIVLFENIFSLDISNSKIIK